MTYAFMSLAIVIGLGIIVLLIQMNRYSLREHARREKEWVIERRDLVDRIMHMKGQTWTPPPMHIEEEDVQPIEFYLPDLEPLE